MASVRSSNVNNIELVGKALETTSEAKQKCKRTDALISASNLDTVIQRPSPFSSDRHAAYSPASMIYNSLITDAARQGV